MKKNVIRKALTFRASSIGDCLMGRYFLENIHVAFPEAKLAIVVASRGDMIRDLCASTPWLEVIETNRRDIPGLLRLWKIFGGSDVTVTQYTGKVGTSFGLASKIAARLLTRRGGHVGFKDSFWGNRFIYDQVVPMLEDMPVVEHEREALRALGIPVSVPYPVMTYESDTSVLEKFSLTAGTYVVAHFFAGNAGRSVSPGKARLVVQELQKHLAPSTGILVSGAQADKVEAAHIIAELPGARSIAGEVSLQEMMQLVNGSLGVVSVDTGIAHISAELQKPLVVLRTCLWPNWWFAEAYGPSARIRQFSREELCTPHIAGSYPVCINAIDADAVAESARELFSNAL